VSYIAVGSPLPEWRVSAWLNTPHRISVESLRGKVVLLHTFQMLCPGCVSHALPQAQRVRQLFPESEVAVIGLHTVFEHHSAMTETALQAFVHEYRWSFPIGIDHSGGPSGIPMTMTAYGLRGTPTHILLDRDGRVALHQFGPIDDLALGTQLGQLLHRSPLQRTPPEAEGMPTGKTEGCGAEACELSR
jgi:peroxiredoxin